MFAGRHGVKICHTFKKKIIAHFQSTLLVERGLQKRVKDYSVYSLDNVDNSGPPLGTHVKVLLAPHS